MEILAVFLLPKLLLLSTQAGDSVGEAAIKSVVEGETLAFANADLAKWSGYFVHESYLPWTLCESRSSLR